MLKLKLPLLCFIIVFVFSSFLGLLNGVAFFKLVFRALISGCVAAGFVLSAREILERYIPELFEKENEKEFDTVAQTLGSKLNINIDDEEQSRFGETDASEDIFGESGKNEGLDKTATGTESLGADETYIQRDEDCSEEGLTNETETGSPEETREIESLQIEQVNGTSDDSQLQKNFAAGNEIEAEPAPIHADKNGEKTDGVLEELPNLQEFEPGDEVFSANRHVEDFTETGTDSFLITGDSAENKTDSALIAKAVQTLLRQES